MSEIIIKDADLSSLKGKVVIVTGTYIHHIWMRRRRVPTSAYLTCIPHNPSYSRQTPHSRWFLGNRSRNHRPPFVSRCLRRQRRHQPSTYFSFFPLLLLCPNKRGNLVFPRCSLQSRCWKILPHRLRIRQCRNRSTRKLFSSRRWREWRSQGASPWGLGSKLQECSQHRLFSNPLLEAKCPGWKHRTHGIEYWITAFESTRLL